MHAEQHHDKNHDTDAVGLHNIRKFQSSALYTLGRIHIESKIQDQITGTIAAR